ncbi:MAG: hypothetical protein ACQESJ_01505 [Bacteroidota bacterium]
MKRTKIILIAILFVGSILISACHITEPPCPAYVDSDQKTEQNS